MLLCNAKKLTFVKALFSRGSRQSSMGFAILLACVVHVMNLSSSTARDLDAMAGILVPAYTAMNYAVICAQVPISCRRPSVREERC